jgi:hypothetical protein
MALRDDIKAGVSESAPAIIPVPTPEIPKWDGQIFVTSACPRAIANVGREADEAESLDEKAGFVQIVACDSSGSRIWQPEDVLWLSTTAAMQPVVERLYAAGLFVCGLTRESRDAWRKNLPVTAGAGSRSSS